jgi:uncharacterized protein YggE
MRLILPGLLFALLLAPAAGGQPAPPGPPPPTIVTQGSATVKRQPDRAFITFATETRADRPDDAQSQNAVAMQKVREQLASAGIPSEAIRTISFNLREDIDFVNGNRIPRGYVVTNAIEVRVDDIDDLGSLMDDVVKAGATSVSGVRFDLKDREQAEQEAVRLAVADARGRADAAAAGAGVAVGPIVRIEEHGERGPVPRPMPMQMSVAREAADAPSTPVAAGEIVIEATVTLTVSIAGAQ